MSGTSTDGVDIAYCSFEEENPERYKIVHAETIPYSDKWRNRLMHAVHCNGVELARMHTEYAALVAKMVNEFIEKRAIKPPSVIGFHGHTLFHRPDLGFTFQVGSGSVLAARTAIDTVSDFRTANVALGGHGAPLVPIGDLHLFPDHKICINLGGFGNISVKEKERITAYDICPVNIPLNELAAQRGLQFDCDGKLASKGRIIADLLEAMNSLSYYSKTPPKSLGREWYEECFNPILKNSKCSTEDLLATVCEHIAIKISESLKKAGEGGILITGGGAKNQHLISRITAVSGRETEIPANEVIDYKEALIFAYLATLRVQSELNCLKSYTGARADLCAGQLHIGHK